MMINENGSTTESIIINCLNSSDALVIIDNQLNNNITCPTITFPTTTNFLDLCNFVEVQQISQNSHIFDQSSQLEMHHPINVNVTPTVHSNGTSLNSPDSSTTSSNNISSDKTNETDHEGDDVEDYDESESELTNLNWLTELKNITNLSPPDLPVTDQPTTRFNKFITAVRKSHENYEKRRIMYATCCNEKPPFNYAQIIAMAMLEHGRMTLQGICKWIQERFAYYKTHKNWNNSIRHNLSLNFFFTKVARGKNEKGKGGYWELAMDTSKSHRKRLRRNRNGKYKNSSLLCNNISRNRMRKSHNSKNTQVTSTTTTTNNKQVPDIDMPNEEKIPSLTTPSIASDEELLNDIAANIANNACHPESNVFVSEMTSVPQNEIYFADEIPQCITDDIVLSSSSTSTNSNGIGADGPSVIVEYLPTMDTFDENELNGLINLNEQELIERFLNCGDDHEIFVN